MSVISPENFVMLKFSYKDFKSIQKNYRKFYDINSKKYIAVYKKGLYGILDIETEKLVLPPKYQKICDFKEGYAWVKEKGKWGFIDEDLNDDKSVSFRAFAEICITRQIITAIKTATRQKHMPLNSYISLNKPVFEEEGERALIETINNDRNSDPEYLFISKEELNVIEGKMNEILSPLELEVLYSYLNGSSYQEIAVTLDKPVKSIDNALQRVKKKLEKYLKQRK